MHEKYVYGFIEVSVSSHLFIHPKIFWVFLVWDDYKESWYKHFCTGFCVKTSCWFSKAGFLSIGTIDIWGHIILCRDCSVPCGVFRGLLSLHPIGGNSAILLCSAIVAIKSASGHWETSRQVGTCAVWRAALLN